MIRTKPKTIIVDPDVSSRNHLKLLIARNCPEINVIAELSEVDEAVDCIKNEHPSLVFWDMLLPQGSALKALYHLDEFNGHLVFTTVYDEFVLRAFRHYAIDYLMKPIDEDALKELVLRLQTRIIQKDIRNEMLSESFQTKKFEKIILNAAGYQHVVQIGEILHLEGDGNYSTVHLTDGEKIMVSKPLKFFEDILPAKNFFRVHQSHIVNLMGVKSVSKGDVHQVLLKNGNKVPLSRRNKDAFIALLVRI